MGRTVYSVGHSNHSIERFVALLRGQEIGAVADVRSVPYSRRLPHFSKAPLSASLKDAGLVYVFLGDQLGARPQNPACYRDGRVDYALVAATEAFKTGLDRVERGAERYRLALLCAEREPLDCHRTLLVSRHLRNRGTEIRHILADGTVEPHEETEARLLKQTDLETGDLFAGETDRRCLIEEAYRRRNPAALAIRQ